MVSIVIVLSCDHCHYAHTNIKLLQRLVVGGAFAIIAITFSENSAHFEVPALLPPPLYCWKMWHYFEIV